MGICPTRNTRSPAFSAASSSPTSHFRWSLESLCTSLYSQKLSVYQKFVDTEITLNPSLGVLTEYAPTDFASAGDPIHLLHASEMTSYSHCAPAPRCVGGMAFAGDISWLPMVP